MPAPEGTDELALGDLEVDAGQGRDVVPVRVVQVHESGRDHREPAGHVSSLTRDSVARRATASPVPQATASRRTSAETVAATTDGHAVVRSMR